MSSQCKGRGTAIMLFVVTKEPMEQGFCDSGIKYNTIIQENITDKSILYCLSFEELNFQIMIK